MFIAWHNFTIPRADPKVTAVNVMQLVTGGRLYPFISYSFEVLTSILCILKYIAY